MSTEDKGTAEHEPHSHIGAVVTAADDALDRLVDCERRHWAPDPNRQQIAKEFDAALATVREVLERLREERDAARVGHRVLLDAQNELIERAESAEAELERLRELASHESDEIVHWREQFEAMSFERDAAEAKVRRLTEGLREIERMAGAAGYGETPAKPIAEKARALLAGSPSETVSATPRTDSPPESGEDYDYKDDSAEGRWGVKSSHPDGGGAK